MTFFEFGIKDIIDIVLVALILYYVYRLMKESRSLNVFIGIMVFVLVWLFVSQVLEMRLLGSIMDKLVSVGVIGLIVLFQEEIRKFFYNLGAHQRMQNVMTFFTGKKVQKVDKESIMPIVMACMSMSRGKVGALIVIERAAPLTILLILAIVLMHKSTSGLSKTFSSRTHLFMMALWLLPKNVSRLPGASFLSVTIMTSPSILVCVIVPLWEYHRRVTPLPLLSRKKRGASVLPTKASSSCVFQQNNWKVF